eukprot:TRINITY_DN5947_c0_g1_i4.p1 TRINITY_DN5947_c0_g1~~TRINITY_DN5947_c0_g1_i4.p1  ORF type:complete len:494 (-),score=135.69 TRINITY_DN5947_c0_g1_i4:25-1506(-)
MMYTLLSRIEDGVKPMLETLQDFVYSFGLDSLRAIPDELKLNETKYVTTLLSVYNKFNELVTTAFNSDTQFVASLDKAMRRLVNENPINKNSTKSPELLAKYADFLLCKTNKEFEFEKIDTILNQILVIFKYIDDKDVFQKFYSKNLAKRLIQGTSISDDAESAMIGGLKQSCGYEYTSKLQRMFGDIHISQDLNDKFKESLGNDNTGFGGVGDMNVLVLTAGSWPLNSPQIAFNVPEELEKAVNLFSNFYSNKHSGRRLTWLHHLGKADLKSYYLKKKYEFQVTNYQMGILLMFNRSEKITVEEIGNSTGLKDKELTRTIVSLIKAKILKREAAAKKKGDEAAAAKDEMKEDLKDDSGDKEDGKEEGKSTAGAGGGGGLSVKDVVALNKAFVSKRMRFKVTTALTRETPKENEEAYKSISEERRSFLQAAIVRIMKARKTLNHANLVQETIGQAKARFKPSVPSIKKCIEQLIELQYLQRVEGESNTYAYLA